MPFRKKKKKKKPYYPPNVDPRERIYLWREEY
jgi:hypothetical protein